ncbi:MAG: hypothetical protein ACKO3S_07380 [bacterium]
MRARGPWWLAGLVVLASSAPVRAAEPVRDPSCGVTVVVPAAGVAVTRLPRGFVRSGSDSVWSALGPWVRGRDYRLDLLRGDLRLLRALAPGETLWVRTCGLLAPPPLEYQRLEYRPAPAAGASGIAGDSARPVPLAVATRPATARDPAGAPSGSALTVNGNKTLAVDFGSSQDAALRQSLDLSISGRVAPGVELTGVLTDRDTPVSADGSTQDLQSIDRVLLELRARDGRAALGDLPLSVTNGEFARLERRVQGVAGEWRTGGFGVRAGAAGSQGEYRRLQFNGVDGRQGPYLLTDRDGVAGVTVVAGSEQVTVDGERMTRGEGADYAIDYERGRLTFSNRRPISSASRITVEYQYALTRYRRNLALGAVEWRQGRWALFAQGVTEGDDSGRPLAGALDASDRAALAAAGDSVALGAGAVPGTGDYDTLSVAGVTRFAFVGIDSGAFAVRFARVGEGRGDYADSAVVAGRATYRWVGPGLGAYRVGRALPAPESHRLASFGASTRWGAITLDAEGALSRFDRNTLSARDGSDDAGGAARVRLEGEGRVPFLSGRSGFAAAYRAVESRFAPFTRLERAFAEEDWGLAPGADLEHPRRGDVEGWWRPRAGHEFAASWSHLVTPDGYRGQRRRASARWGSGPLTANGALLDAAGSTAGRAFGDGGRTRLTGDLRWAGAWLAPAVRAERDRRETPGDTAVVRDRVDALDLDLAAGARVGWRMAVGAGTRRDRREAGRTATATRTRTLRTDLETPAAQPVGVVLSGQRRDTRDESSGALVRQDLASVRLRGDWRPAGLSGSVQVERTGEAENRRVRTLTFVGGGRGGYDATGNFVGTGDYDLVLAVSPELERYARTATSARATWAFGRSESWRGSRLELVLEDEARRRGGGRFSDVLLAPAVATGDAALARGSVQHRIEADLAPGSRAAAFRVRAERRVSADRSFENFAQVTEERSGALRWRTRPGTTTSAELETRLAWQRASQSFVAGARYDRTLFEQAATARLVWQPATSLRGAAVGDLSWSRPVGGLERTRTLRVGPDLSLGVGRHGRADVTLRRAFVSGPPAIGLLPSADPAGAARWDATARFDYRVHTTTSVGFDASVRERPGRATVVTGRAEVRAFF